MYKVKSVIKVQEEARLGLHLDFVSSPHYLCLQLLHNRSMQLFMKYILYIRLTSFEIQLNLILEAD